MIKNYRVISLSESGHPFVLKSESSPLKCVHTKIYLVHCRAKKQCVACPINYTAIDSATDIEVHVSADT